MPYCVQLLFYSAKLKDAYPTHECQMLAVVKSLKIFLCYIHGYPIIVLTDHRTFQFFQDQDKYSYRQVKWNEFTQQFNIPIKYQTRKCNVVADYLSRQPDLEKICFYYWNLFKFTRIIHSFKPNSEQLNTTVIQSQRFNELRKVQLAQAADEDCQQMVKEPQKIPAQFKTFVKDGILYEHHRLYVPNNQSLKSEILFYITITLWVDILVQRKPLS